MEPFHQYSAIVSKALDTLGYSYNSIKTGQANWKEWCKRRNDEINDKDATFIFAGSKAEGVTGLLESDVDVMFVFNTCICCEEIQDVDTDINTVVFVMDRDNVAPGYTRLRHTDFAKVRRMSRRERDRGMEDLVSGTFQNENGEFLLSSEFFIASLCDDDDGIKPEDRAGPALTISDIQLSGGVDVHLDCVGALPCKCNSILEPWIARPRHHNWPSKELIQEISTMDGHVVPVGVKGSSKQYEEWRICYTTVETALIKSFNETQLKLYALLKMVAKKLLKPVCPDITSYIMKNVMFWVAEQIPSDHFRLEDVMGLLMLSLRILMIQVDTECLENYMIPARNLFAGKLEQPQKQEWLRLLSSLIREGPTFILQFSELDVLRTRMVQVYRNPELALYEQRQREKTSMYTFFDSPFECFKQSAFITTLNAFCVERGVDPEPQTLELYKLLQGYFN